MKPMKKIRTAIEMWTPEKAQAALVSSTGNRTINEPWVAELARRMIQNEWQENGEPIIIDWDGNVINGQHRLKAIIRANVVTLNLNTVRDASPEAFSTFDNHRPRSLSTVLQLAHYTNTSALAGASRIMLGWLRGKNTTAEVGARTNIDQVKLVLAAFPKFEESVRFGDHCRKTCDIRLGMVAVLHALTTTADAQLGEEFCTSVRTGEGLSQTDPRYRLREAASKDRRMRVIRHGSYWLWLGVKAWNHYVAGTPCRVLTVREDELPLEVVGLSDTLRFGAWDEKA